MSSTTSVTIYFIDPTIYDMTFIEIYDFYKYLVVCICTCLQLKGMEIRYMNVYIHGCICAHTRKTNALQGVPTFALLDTKVIHKVSMMIHNPRKC